MTILSIRPVSIITHDGRQWLDIHGEAPCVRHGRLRTIRLPDQTILDETPVALDSSRFHQRPFMRAPTEDIAHGRWEFWDTKGNLLWHGEGVWPKPRHWTIHIVISSHTDIGLHNSQYILLWGKSPLPNLHHYEIHRSTEAGFTPSSATLVATVKPGEYCVERFEELGLDTHVCYYHRIRAMDVNEMAGPFSGEFSAWTREPLPQKS